MATGYERAGACAISVLTDEQYFGGSIADLGAIRATTDVPLLRKDFIIDEIQIYEAAAAGADAVLLIAAVLNDIALEKLRATAEDELGLDALVEVHTSEELHCAVGAGARIIGVNNRDLHTFQVDLEHTLQLRRRIRSRYRRVLGPLFPGYLFSCSQRWMAFCKQVKRVLFGFCFRSYSINRSTMDRSPPALRSRSSDNAASRNAPVNNSSA